MPYSELRHTFKIYIALHVTHVSTSPTSPTAAPICYTLKIIGSHLSQLIPYATIRGIGYRTPIAFSQKKNIKLTLPQNTLAQAQYLKMMPDLQNLHSIVTPRCVSSDTICRQNPNQIDVPFCSGRYTSKLHSLLLLPEGTQCLIFQAQY